jgi:hypothetical protein
MKFKDGDIIRFLGLQRSDKYRVIYVDDYSHLITIENLERAGTHHVDSTRFQQLKPVLIEKDNIKPENPNLAFKRLKS